MNIFILYCKGKLLLFLTFGIIYMLSVACSKEPDSKISNESEFYNAYMNLYLVHNSPDFPANADVISVCLNNRNEGCYKVVQWVKAAKQTLQEADNNTALSVTITTIIKYCRGPALANDPNESLCEGALTALYFFDKEEQDQYILSEINKLDKDINERIFKRNREWYYNRINIKPWLGLVGNKLQGTDLDLQISRFKINNVRPFGLMLLEDPIPHGETLSY